MNQGISTELADFLSRHIDSLVQLELLLLLRSSVPREWSAAEIARELRIETVWAASQAADLCDRGLLACRREAEPVYQYKPADSSLERVVAMLAETYASRRVSVISFIYSKPPDQLKRLADAFRIRKENRDG